VAFFRVGPPLPSQREIPGPPRFLASLFLRATLSDPGRPSRISPFRSFCVGFRFANTVAACSGDVTRLNRLGECGLPCGPQDSLCTLRIACSAVVDFLLHIRNTRYGWLVRPYPTGTLTLKEMPGFPWRTSNCQKFCPIRGSLIPSFRRRPESSLFNPAGRGTGPRPARNAGFAGVTDREKVIIFGNCYK